MSPGSFDPSGLAGLGLQGGASGQIGGNAQSDPFDAIRQLLQLLQGYSYGGGGGFGGGGIGGSGFGSFGAGGSGFGAGGVNGSGGGGSSGSGVELRPPTGGGVGGIL